MSSQENPQKCGNPKCTTAPPLPDSGAPPSSTLLKCGRCKKEAYCSRPCQAAAWPRHKRSCVRPNYIIKFQLSPEYVTDPPVSRTLSCPADAVFYHLHMALQVAFGWSTTHSFDFAVANPDYVSPFAANGGVGADGQPDFSALMEHLKRMNPAHGADPSAPQEYLFRVVDPVEQTMFSGVDRVHEGGRRHPNTPEKKADNYKLYQLFDDPKYQGRFP
ncbi:hypothetical protein SLS62_010882 [Diatrype stigma]|uniref:MYND-type domain-containing protein n=1 Tax=Diatrype stigma TaxID=117547 RepID=A0AAN9U965_9PEZI